MLRESSWRRSCEIAFAVVCSLTVVKGQVVRVSPVQTIARNLNIELDAGSTIKCGTPLIALARERWNDLSPQARFEISSVLVRPSLEKSRPSPSGKLRIHYDTSATSGNTPALLNASGQRIPNSFEAYVDSVSSIFDYCWQYEVDSLGYLPPPADSVSGAAALGGDSKYDVYVMQFNDGTFGQTQYFNEILLSPSPNEKYTSYIEIENDFQGYRTSGINGLKVTAAHELHHAIQIGKYGIWSNNDLYFNELTSSWMEDVVFTSINDYYFDVKRYFQNYRDGLNRSFPFTKFDPSFAGYERSIWAHFLTKRFGRNVMRAIWEKEQSQPLFQGMRSALESYGTNLEAEYALFTYWNFFTADRADTVRFYPEGKSYPRLVRNAAVTFSGSTAVMSNGAFPFSAQMYEVVYGSDTVNAFVVNTDADAVLRGDNAVRNLEVRVSLTGAGPHQTLANGLSFSLLVDQLQQWRPFFLSSASKDDIATVQKEASPNPLRLSDNQTLVLPVDEPVASEAEVLIVGSSLDLAFSDRLAVTELYGKTVIAIPTQNLRSKIASGVYVVLARVGEREYRWKVAVIR